MVLKRSLLFFFLTSWLVASCANHPKTLDGYQGSFLSNYKDVNLNSSFAFTFEDNQYYVANTIIENDPHRCPIYVGYKNNQMAFSFSAVKMEELSNTYYKNLSPEEKKKKIIEKIETYRFNSKECTKENALPTMTTNQKIESGIYCLVYCMAIPLALVFNIGPIVESAQEAVFNYKLDEIRLGMSREKVEKLTGRPLSVGSANQYSYNYVDNGKYRMIFFFKDNRLDSFVRGKNSEQAHESPTTKD